MELPHSSKKQKEIKQLIYTFRFLNSKQIQKLLNHKDSKTINTWLKDLTENKYLERDYTKTFGSSHIPAIYYIGLNGIRFLKKYHNLDKDYAKRLYGEKDKSDSFKNHHIFLADIYLSLPASYTYMSKSQLWEYEELRELKIDAYIKTTKRYFLTLFDKYVPDYVLEYRVKQYIKFYNSNKWNEIFVSKKFPTVLFILPNTQKLSIIRKAIKKSHPQFNISITTTKEVQTKGFTANIWEEV
ncbi:MAG: replication-relaxation family protein [Candidatus Daviesbacteria bacterium]|nr:replication-relaxation family protein [Candidatus Daviesbacteria bacterium]